MTATNTQKKRSTLSFSVRVSEENQMLIDPDILDPQKKYLRPLDSAQSDYFETPISFDFLAQMLRENSTHETCVTKKVDMIMSGYDSKSKVSRQTAQYLVSDFFLCGNAYLLRQNSGEFFPLLARTVRKHKKNGEFAVFAQGKAESVFPKEKIAQVINPAPESLIYGLPVYLSALRDMALVKAAKEYRYSMSVNGSDGRVILLNTTNEQEYNEETKKYEDAPAIKKLKEDLKNLKGSGKNKTMVMIVDNEKLDDVSNILHVENLGPKLKEDGFEETCQEARKSIINAHGLHPELIGVQTENKSSVNFERAWEMTQKTVVKPARDLIAQSINKVFGPGTFIFLEPDEKPES